MTDVGEFNYVCIEISHEAVKANRVYSAYGCFYYLAHARMAYEQDVAFPAGRIDEGFLDPGLDGRTRELPRLLRQPVAQE